MTEERYTKSELSTPLIIQSAQADASLYSRDFQDTVGEFVGGVTPQLWGEAFAFNSVVTNLHYRANASPLPAHFRGEGFDPSLIRQQHPFSRSAYKGVIKADLVLFVKKLAHLYNKQLVSRSHPHVKSLRGMS